MGWRVVRCGLVVWLLGLSVLLSRPLHAAEPAILQSALQRTPEGLFLSARLDLKPSPAVEDALLKGVPLYFVWQAEVVRERWYWTDKRLAQPTRIWRLAYQPLTRRWRLSLSTDTAPAGAGAGLQYALHQNFDALADALASVARVAQWKLLDAARLQDAADEYVLWSFRLELGLLPRPFQIGMANQPEWVIEVQRRVGVPSAVTTTVALPVEPDDRTSDEGGAAR
ncbi:MAG: DUF4390 domain-containing protein [Hydrogenophaga sp.]